MWLLGPGGDQVVPSGENVERCSEGKIQFKDGCFDGNFYPSFDLIFGFVIFLKLLVCAWLQVSTFYCDPQGKTQI